VVFFCAILGFICLKGYGFAQVSGDVSVSAQVLPSTQNNIENQGGAIPPFFISPQQIQALKTATLIFSGQTSPGAAIMVKLIQADITFSGYAQKDGSFHIEYQTLYNNYDDVLIESTDLFGKKSSVQFPINIIPGKNRKENIFFAPTVILKESEIFQGDSLFIEGTSYPLSNIVINISDFNQERNFQFLAKSDLIGKWQTNIQSTDFLPGTYFISVFAQDQSGKISLKTQIIVFRVLKKTKADTGKPQIKQRLDFDASVVSAPFKKVDLNNDKKVSLKDLSILLAYWGKKIRNNRVDLNNDGKIDFKDLSIMMFYFMQ